ncbi:MAG: hypothetical protein QG635_2407 [Bacteroidota bacterium]|nr:hypothetical protein [Bacteroidota bacterium]
MQKQEREKSDFSPETIYRMPWNLADNAISWLEPTSKCNLYCDGCYRENRDSSHKSIEEIKKELDVFKKFRKTDSISIAGGEPLMHPQICDIVHLIRSYGWKPVINTNAQLLTPDLLKELKKAGVDGFTLHIDSGQNRPGWKGKNEIELCELRYRLARMLADVGGITCSFNATVYPETLKYVPELVKWAHKNIDIAHIMVFIIYRMAVLGKEHNYFVGDREVFFDDMTYSTNDDDRRIDISSPEVVEEIRKIEPNFMPSAYLNGTEQPDTYKWLFSCRMGSKKQVFGYSGPKFMEIVQTVKHLTTGSYLAYSHPNWLHRGRLYFLLSCFDKGIREIAKKYFNSFFENPFDFFKRLYMQTILIIQPADVSEDGQINMCDGCPDITVWNDRLVWSCRMEEQYRWGQNVRLVQKRSDG